MTISSSLRRAGPFLGNGVTVSFPFGFKVFAKSDVLVTLTDETGVETELVLDSGYSVTLSPNQDSDPGGVVSYPLSGGPLPVNRKLTLSGNLPYSQPADIQNSGGFYPQVVENALDRLTIQTQQLAEEAARSVKVDISDPTPPNQLFNEVLARASAAADAAESSEEAAETAAGTATTAATNAELSAQEAAEAVTDMALFVSVAPAGNIASTNVQAALQELDAEKPQKSEAQWFGKAIGEPFFLQDDLAGVATPPTNSTEYRFIKLTASDAYNTGVLTSESVSGSAPEINATAVISLAGSPVNGRTVRLINTERRFIRAGSAGTLQDSDNRAHTHGGAGGASFIFGSNAGITAASSGSGGTTWGVAANTASAGGTEARSRNIGATAYMRIK